MRVVVVAVVCLLHLGGGVEGANPNYSYHVKIDDPAYVNFQEKAETRKGEDAQGFYSVLEPNGALRTVSYTADERGFNPIVSYSYGHPQSSVAVHSAAGPAAILQKTGVYAPAYVADNRVQVVDKSNIYAAPPPALNFQTFSLPGPSSPVIVPQPLRQVAPVVSAAAAITTNYAPAYVPPPRAYLPPPQPQYVSLAAPPPPTYAVAVPQPQPQQFISVQQPQISLVQQPPQAEAVFVKRVRPAKVLTVPVAPAVKVVKTTPALAVVKDSYSEPPRDTFRDPNAQSYPDAVKVVKEPTSDYGPPAYVPPPVISEAPPVKVRVVQPKVKVVQPVIQQQQVYLPPPPQIAVQKVVAPPPQVAIKTYAPPPVALNPGLYAGAIGYHTLTSQPDSYLHSYGTQGFQVHNSRKFNKVIYTEPKQIIRQPPPVYGPPPAIQVQKVVQPAPVCGPPPQIYQEYGPPPQPVKVVQPKPVYGPPPSVNVVHQHHQVVQQQVLQHAAPLPQLHQYVQAPPPQVQVAYPPPPAPVQVAAPAPVAVQAAPAPQTHGVSLTGGKQHPLVFSYSYDQGAAKVTHSYSGSGW